MPYASQELVNISVHLERTHRTLAEKAARPRGDMLDQSGQFLDSTTISQTENGVKAINFYIVVNTEGYSKINGTIFGGHCEAKPFQNTTCEIRTTPGPENKSPETWTRHVMRRVVSTVTTNEQTRKQNVLVHSVGRHPSVDPS